MALPDYLTEVLCIIRQKRISWVKLYDYTIDNFFYRFPLFLLGRAFLALFFSIAILPFLI